mgnify:CR=1 FL=1
MTIDTTIDQYRATKEAMQAIIDRKVKESLAECQDKSVKAAKHGIERRTESK